MYARTHQDLAHLTNVMFSRWTSLAMAISVRDRWISIYLHKWMESFEYNDYD